MNNDPWVTDELAQRFHKSLFSMAGNAFNAAVASIMIVVAMAVLGQMELDSTRTEQIDQTEHGGSDGSASFLKVCVAWISNGGPAPDGGQGVDCWCFRGHGRPRAAAALTHHRGVLVLWWFTVK